MDTHPALGTLCVLLNTKRDHIMRSCTPAYRFAGIGHLGEGRAYGLVLDCDGNGAGFRTRG